MGKKYLLFVLFIGLIFRLFIFSMIAPYTKMGEKKILKDDAYGYHVLGLELKNEKTFAKNNPYVSALRTPGYPFFIAIVYKIFGEKPARVILTQILIDIVLIYLIFLFARMILNEKIGLIAASLYAVNPIAVQYSNLLLSDSLFTFFIFLNYLFLWKYVERKKISYVGLSVLFLAIATYIRPVGFYLVFINSLFMLLYIKKIKKETDYKSFIIYIMMFYILVLPWILRNKTVHGHLFFSTSADYNSLVLYASDVEAEAKNMDQRQIMRYYNDEFKAKYPVITNQNIYNLHQEYKKTALKIIKRYPFAFIKSYFMGIIDMYFSVNRHIWEMITNSYNKIDYDALKLIKSNPINGLLKVISDYNLNLLIYAFVMIGWFIVCYTLVAMGIIELVKIKKFNALVFLLIPVVYFTFITGQAGLARFKLPFIPFYSILAAFGIYFKKNRIKKLFLIS